MKDHIIKHIHGGYFHWEGAGQERVTQKERATHYTKESADRVIRCSIAESERKNWFSVKDESAIGFVSKDILEFFSEFEWLEISEKQRQLFQSLMAYKEELREKHSEIDREICDIQHYIEFFSLDAAKGYKAYRMLKDRLMERRHIKTELAKTECLLCNGVDDYASGKVVQQIKGIDNRSYTPRVLNELFDISKCS